MGDVATDQEVNENFSDEQLKDAVLVGIRTDVVVKPTVTYETQKTQRKKAQNLVNRINTKIREETYTPTDLDKELEAIAPRGERITTEKQIEAIVDKFRPIAAKLGFKIIYGRKGGGGAMWSTSKNAVVISKKLLFDRVSQGLDRRPTGTGSNYIVSVMREEIIHGAMSKVLQKKNINILKWYTELGKSLTDAQRKALNDNYVIEGGSYDREGRKNHGS